MPHSAVGSRRPLLQRKGAPQDRWNQENKTWNTEGAFPWGVVAPAATFSPSSLSNLLMWLKADAGTWQNSTLTTPAVADGDRVGGLVEQGGATAGNFTNATSNQRGTLKLNVQNGLPVIRFSGGNQSLALAAEQTVSGDFSWFVVASTTIGGTGSVQQCALFGYISTGATAWQYTGIAGGTGFPNFSGKINFPGGNFGTGGGGAWTTNQWSVTELHKTGTTYTAYRDGTPLPVTVSNHTLGIGQLSGYQGGNLNFAGDFGESILCTTFLAPSSSPNSTLLQCRRYLKNRWGTP